LKVLTGILAALCWLGSTMTGFSLLLNPMDRSVAGWSGMLLMVLLSLAGIFTGLFLLRFANPDRAWPGNAGWLCIGLTLFVWVDMRVALGALTVLPLVGIWLLVRWFRQKPAGRAPGCAISE